MKKTGFAFKKILNRLVGNNSNASNKNKRRKFGRTCQIEELESREMLSVNMLAFDALQTQYDDFTDTNFVDTVAPSPENVVANAPDVASAPEFNPLSSELSDDEFTYLRYEKYAELRLSENKTAYNVIVITADQLLDSTIRTAITTASTNGLDNLIVVRTGTTTAQNTITLTAGELAIDSGKVTIVSLGDEKLTIDANQESRVLNIGEGAIVGLAGLTITKGGNVSEGGGIYNRPVP